MNFSSSTLDGELIVLRLPQEQKMFESSRHRLFHSFFITIMHDLHSNLFKTSSAQQVYIYTREPFYSLTILKKNHTLGSISFYHVCSLSFFKHPVVWHTSKKQIPPLTMMTFKAFNHETSIVVSKSNFTCLHEQYVPINARYIYIYIYIYIYCEACEDKQNWVCDSKYDTTICQIKNF